MGEKMDIGFGLGTLELGGDSLDNALGAIATGIGAFFSAYQLRQDTQAKLEQNKAQLAYKYEELKQKRDFQNRQLDVQQFGHMATREAAFNKANLDRQTELDKIQAGKDILSQKQTFLAEEQWPHETALREMVPGSTKYTVDALNQREENRLTSEEERSGNYRAMSMVRLLHEQGLLSPENEDGTPNPNYQQEVADAMYFYSLDPDEQGAYLEEKAAMDEEAAQQAQEEQEANFQQNVVPGMRQQAIGVLGQNRDVRKRMELLEQETGGQVRFQDIYGLPAQDVLGGKGQVPTVYLHEPTEKQGVLRQDKQGTYQPNLDPFKQSLGFLNRKTQASIKDRMAKLRAIPTGRSQSVGAYSAPAEETPTRTAPAAPTLETRGAKEWYTPRTPRQLRELRKPRDLRKLRDLKKLREPKALKELRKLTGE